MNVRDILEQASGLISTHRLERTQAELERNISEQPRNARLWMRHAEVCQRLGQTRFAVVSLRTAALLFGDIRETNLAATALRMAIKLAPHDRKLKAELSELDQVRWATSEEFIELPSQRELSLADSKKKTQVVHHYP